MMPHFERTMVGDLDSLDIINLHRILELCNVPEVGPSPLDPHLSAEGRYTNALSVLEKTAAVFDDLHFESAVLAEQLSEAAIERELFERASSVGVPESHHPSNRLRSQLPCPTVPVVSNSRPAPVKPAASPVASSGFDGSLTAPSQRISRASSSFRRSSPTLLSSSSASVRPSLSIPRSSLSLPSADRFLKNIMSLVPSSNSPRRSTAGDSVASYASSSSQDSQGKPNRRDSLIQMFRRDFSFADKPNLRDESIAWSTEPSLASPTAHDQSSLQTNSISSRTSTCSSVDLNTFSWLERRALQKPMKSQRFLDLQKSCQEEGKRFVDFSQHQRVALPLFLGRTRAYLEGRMARKMANLERKHELALEELDNRHFEQELASVEAHQIETQESTTKNVTALKYVHGRLSLLGEEATPEQLKRLEQEQNALGDLAVRQERDMNRLLRTQGKQRLNLQRQQEKELLDLKLSLREDYDAKVLEKKEELQKNMLKLDELIHSRTLRIVARWHLQLQIFKKEDKDACFIKGPLPLSMLALPDEFAPYIICYH